MGGGSGGVCPLAAEIVLDPDHVLELGARHLDQLDPLDRPIAMRPAHRDQPVVAWAELLCPNHAIVARATPKTS